MVPERVTAAGGRRGRAAAIVAAAVLGVTASLLTLGAHLVERPLATTRGLTRSIFLTPDFAGPPQSRERVDRIDLSFLVEDPDLPRERLSVRWEGFWSVPDRNPIEFYTRADDSLEIFVDGERVLERDRGDGTRMVAQRVVVTPGVRRVRLDYVQRDGVARLVVEWAPAGRPRRRFDAAHLFTETPPPGLVRRTAHLEWLEWAARPAWTALGALAVAILSVPGVRAWRRADPLTRARDVSVRVTRSPAARALAVIVVAAILIRVGLLWVSVGRPEFAWVDPDNYWARARRFVADGEWRWTMEAVHFRWGFFKAPLYPVFLSLFVPLGESARWTVAIVQAVMGSLALVCIFAAGRFVHSNRAGLLAAGAFAVLLTQSTKLVVFWQEHVYVPLIALSFACLAFACTRAWRPAVWPFVCAGVSFGVAALTRSMPLYFVPIAGVLWWARGPDRRTRAIEASVFLVAFAAVVTPYSLFVSSIVGRPVPIENVGSYLLLREDAAARRAPDLSRALEAVWTDFAASPPAFLADKSELLLWGNFRPPTDGPLGSWVRTLGPLETRRQASALEWAVRLFGDLPIMIAMILAPIGWVLARNRPPAMMLGAWIPVHLACSTIAGYGGHRFREPIEPLLFVFAAVVCAGGWRRVGLPAVLAAAGISLVVAVPLFDRLGALHARVDYGIRGWKTTETGRETTAEGDAGFLLEAPDGRIAMSLRRVDGRGPDHVEVDLSADGRLERTIAVGPDPLRVDWSTNGQSSVFVTIEPRGGAAPSLGIVVIEPPPGGA